MKGLFTFGSFSIQGNSSKVVIHEGVGFVCLSILKNSKWLTFEDFMTTDYAQIIYAPITVEMNG